MFYMHLKRLVATFCFINQFQEKHRRNSVFTQPLLLTLCFLNLSRVVGSLLCPTGAHCSAHYSKVSLVTLNSLVQGSPLTGHCFTVEVEGPLQLFNAGEFIVTFQPEMSMTYIKREPFNWSFKQKTFQPVDSHVWLTLSQK